MVILLPVSAFSIYSAIFAAPSGGDWTTFGFDNSESRDNAGSTVTSANVATLKLAWTISTPGAVTGTPIVSNGFVYFADWKGNVYAININTHAQEWSVNLGDPISDSVLVDQSSNMLFVGVGPEGNVHPTLYALSTADGHTIWSHTFTFAADQLTMNTIFASPILYSGMVYIGVASNDAGETNASKVGELFALNELNGNVVWRYLTTPTPGATSGGGGVWGTATIDPSLNAVIFATGNAYAKTAGTTPQQFAYSIISLDATTGSFHWAYQAYANRAAGGDNDFGSTPNLFSLTINNVNHEAVGIPEKGGNYFVVDRSTGALLLKATIGTGTVAVGGFISSGTNPEVFIPANPNIIAYFPATNTFGWQIAAKHMTGSVAIIPGAVLYSAGKNFYARAISNGATLFTGATSVGINGGISVAEGYVLVPFGGGTPVGGSTTTGGVEALSPSSGATSTSTTSTVTTTTTSMTTATTFTTTSATTTVTVSNQLHLDGTASSGPSKCSSTTTSCSVTLTTSGSSDVIILVVGMASSSATITSVTASGLTFSDRKDETGNSQGIHEWFALTNSPVSSDSITVSRSSGSVNWNIMAFGVSGANTVNAFDSNPSLPCTATGASGRLGCTVSTSNPNDFIFGIGEQGGGSMTWTPTSGFALIINMPPGTPKVNGEFEIVSSTQSSLAESVLSSSSNGWTWIGDAIQQGT